MRFFVLYYQCHFYQSEMKGVIIFIGCIAIVLAGPVIQEDDSQEDMKFFLYEDENGKIRVEDLTIEPTNLTASATDVTYYFCSKSNQNGVQIHSNNIAALKNTAFNAGKDSVFIIHGWLDSHGSGVNTFVKGSILRGHDVNVFVVDWNPIAKKLYPTAKAAVPQIGSFVGAFIQSLVSTYRLNLGKVVIVGHSLGAHVAGRAGAALRGQVSRIVGLDPAGPLFSESDRNSRLDSSNARFVEVIHTNIAKLGYGKPLGHSDYYPNGGRTQAGCGADVTGKCSHERSYQLFAESINSNRFVSKQCSNFNDFKSGKCNNGHRAVMGQYNADSSRGSFYLETNGKSPFAKG